MRHSYLVLPFALIVAACGTDADEAAVDAEAATETAAPEVDPARQAMLDQIRTDTEKYADVAVAEAEGYMKDPSGMCVTAAMAGAPPEQGSMGIHWLSPRLLGITAEQPRVDGNDAVIDPAQPEVLVYEPQADGSMKLVAAEYMVFKAAWDAANPAPPSLAGQEFYLMADDPATEVDEAHGFAPHYELHAWVHQENPNGVFAEFNPAVTCPPMEGHSM